ncbi:MAG: METTL5 family protein [Halodesulfurarchaeum sp.]
MSLKTDLEATLAAVGDFQEPRRDLEQYRTPASVAAHLIALATLQEDIDGRRVVDLGSGTGMLALGAALRSPERVLGVEVDPAAIELARENEAALDCHPVAWVEGDVTASPVDLTGATVVSNPPFGAHKDNRHADRQFLEAIAPDAAVSYTIHNEGSREFLEAFVMDNEGRITHAYGVEFHVPNQFRHHEAENHAIQAELYRVAWDQ